MIKKLIKNLFGSKPEPATLKEQKIKKTPKELATEAGEPWVEVLSMDIDKDNPGAGSFELDWNDKFIINLIKAGYKMREDDTDNIMVDRWMQTVARNIALEVYEQQQADPDMRGMADMRNIRSKDLGNGRSEVG